MKKPSVDVRALALLAVVLFAAGFLVGRCSHDGTFRVVREYKTDSRFLSRNNLDTARFRGNWWRDSLRAYDALPLPEPQKESKRSYYPAKFATDTLVDLNTADTLLLQRIPGIGTGFSKMIVSYRERLGGFCDVRQLCELPNFPVEALAWFTLSAGHIHKINANTADFRTLLHHPYLSYEQTRSIVRYRERVGYLDQIDDLSNDTLFTPTDLARLSVYLSFSHPLTAGAETADSLKLDTLNPSQHNTNE